MHMYTHKQEQNLKGSKQPEHPFYTFEPECPSLSQIQELIKIGEHLSCNITKTPLPDKPRNEGVKGKHHKKRHSQSSPEL